MNALTNILQQTDIFDQVTPGQLELVAGLCEQRDYEVGEVILEEGANSKELYIITSGEVEILVDPSIISGAETPKHMVPIATLSRGQSFGEIALVDEGIRSATVRAAKPQTSLLVIPRDKLIQLCDSSPQLGYRLMYNLAADLAMKIRNTDLRVREVLLYGGKN
jgi:CRP/FNR family transcriptional regulator, cyclic AMP receptor protein